MDSIKELWMNKLKKLWEKQRLLIKLIIMSLTLVVLTLLIMYGTMISMTKNRVIHDYGEQILNIGHEVAADPRVIEAVESGHTSSEIQNYASKEEARFQLDYLVIILKNSTRLTHPNKELIGGHFQGENDQNRALDQGESYYHTGNGPLGRSLRGFVPIYNKQNEVIGAISLGIMSPNLKRFIDRTNHSLVVSLVFSLLIGSFLSFLLAVSLKKQMLGMEPQEIAKVLEERNAMFRKTRDPIILVDTKGYIEYMNETAQAVWPFANGKCIEEILKKINIHQVDQLQLVESRVVYRSYVASLTAVKNGKQLRGYLIILRDTSELKTLVQQLDNSEYFAKQLAEQNHEFMNKLHVIYGLADFERIEELKRYLEQLSQTEFCLNQIMPLLINNSVLAGHLLIHQANRLIYEEISVETEVPEPTNYQETSSWLEEMHFFEDWYQEKRSKTSRASLSLDYQEGELITDIWLDGLDELQIKSAESSFVNRRYWQEDQVIEPTVHLRLNIKYGG